jgi:RNA polymerase sigma-70 factor (ECF subfamily)
VLTGADRETIIHEVFCRLLSDAQLRAGFRGGSLRAWLATIAHNQAIDYRRRRERERPVGDAEDVGTAGARGVETASAEGSVEARLLIERFRDEWLPPKWRGVFQVRFLEQKPQVEAARALGMHRTTLVYQEFRIRQLLRKFFLKTEEA